MAWMHPPVHRLLGWVSRPSALRMSRDVWRLNQCCGLSDQQVFVRGEPAVTDQVTLERMPTLMDAALLDRDGERIGVDGGFRFRRYAVRGERGLEILVTTDEIGWLGPGEEREQQ